MTFKETLGGLKNMVGGLANLGKAILLNPIFLLAGVIIGVGMALKEWISISDQKAIKAQERFTASLERQTEAYARQAEAIRDNGELRLRAAEAQGASEEQLHKIRLQTLDAANKKEVEQLASLSKERANALAENKKIEAEFQKFLTYGDEEQMRKQFESSSARYKAKSKEYSDLKYQLDQSLKERAVIIKEFEAQQAKADEEKAKEDAEKAKQRNADALARQKELAAKLRALQLDDLDLSLSNERKAIEAHYQYLETLNSENADLLIQIAEEKASEISLIEEKERDAAIKRVEDRYKTEVKEAAGSKELLKELAKNKGLEIDAINQDFAINERQRNLETQKQKEQLEKDKVRRAKELNAEIELIDAELNFEKKKGTSDEFNAWSDLQFAKIRQIETLSKLELENQNLTKEERVKIEKEAQLEIQKIQDQSFEQTKEKTVELNEWTKEQKKDVALSAINAAQQLSDMLFQINQNQIQTELNDDKDKFDTKIELLQNQLDQGLISQAEFAAQKSDIESKYNAKEKALKEDAFKKQKAAQLINATIATAVGVANALAAPPPVGLIMAGISAALGAAQIAVIASQPTPKFERGGIAKSGIFGGQSHANGGTKGYFDDGTQIEVEKDEAFVIINKKSTGLLSQLSDINQLGGGVPLMEKGGVMKFESGGVFAASTAQQIENRFSLRDQILTAVSSMPSPVVDVKDIIYATGSRVEVVTNGNFG